MSRVGGSRVHETNYEQARGLVDNF